MTIKPLTVGLVIVIILLLGTISNYKYIAEDCVDTLEEYHESLSCFVECYDANCTCLYFGTPIPIPQGEGGVRLVLEYNTDSIEVYND